VIPLKPFHRLSAALVALTALTAPATAETDWSGFYGGATFAYVMAQEELPVLTATLNGAAVPTGGATGALASAFAGYFFDQGQFVWGGEVEGIFGPGIPFQDTGTCAGVGPCVDAGMVGALDPKLRIRAMLGYEIGPNTLLLGSVGLASADLTYSGFYIKACLAFGCGGVIHSPAPETQTLYGISLGADLEHRLSDNFSLRIGAVYDAYGSFTPVAGGGGASSSRVPPNITRSEVNTRGPISAHSLAFRTSAVFRF
jgi:hypothetical protein